MSTKVFISWSGELSRKLAAALRDWLPAALQFVKPYYTPDDIEKGAKWNSEITKELETSNIGIICLTSDNIEKPWILFESGALSKKSDKSYVCTLLFNLNSSDLKGPLTLFQSTNFNKEDFNRLVATINKTSGDAGLETSVFDSVFEMWWPKLEKQVVDILSSHKEDNSEERRSDRDILEEVLQLTRMNASRMPLPSKISLEVIMDLIHSLDEIPFLLKMGDRKAGHHILKRLDRPLRHICFEAGFPDIYEKYSIDMHNRILHERLEKEMKEEQTSSSSGT